MGFSCEEIFHDYGQFDAFVELTFQQNSEAYKKFGRILLGTFYYTDDERKAMQKGIAKEPIEHTNGRIKFRPSDIPTELNGALRVDLDKKGILNTDIAIVSSLNVPRTNRYTTEGEREIQNKLVIEFDASGTTADQMKLGFLRMRITEGYPLIKEEWEQYNGLELYHNPERWAQVVQTGVVPVNDLNNSEMRFHYLDTKYQHSKFSDAEMKEYEELQTARSKAKAEILVNELKKSDENMKDLAISYKDRLRRILWITVGFETEVILPYKFPIWWDLERFLHIYLRHVKDTNVGDRFVRKSLFRYSFKDVRRIVSAAIEQEYEAIEEHFNNGNTNNFRRQGRRAVYYDGVYYRFEIEPTGLILVFHPEENLDTDPDS
jgi:hypothetical protein